MKIKIIFCLYILSIYMPAYAQSFINDDDYVYAEGYGDTIEKADTNALNALSRNLKSHIISSYEYKSYKHNDERIEYYGNNIKIYSNLIIKESYQYVDTLFKSGYKVYRYINKKNYVSDRLKKIESILNIHKKYPRTLNLILGEYYYAYNILDDDLMELFYPKSKALKNELKRKAINLQNSVIIEETSKLYFNVKNEEMPLYGVDYEIIKNPCFDINNFYFRVIGPYAYNLNFEIEVNGKWIKNYIKSFGSDFSPLYCINCDSSLPRNLNFISNKPLNFRITFEIIDYFDNKIKVEVPNDWYVIHNIIMSSEREIKEWIDKDVKRNFITSYEANLIKKYMFE